MRDDVGHGSDRIPGIAKWIREPCVHSTEGAREKKRERERRVSLHATDICASLGLGKIQWGSDGEILGKDSCRGTGKVK